MALVVKATSVEKNTREGRKRRRVSHRWYVAGGGYRDFCGWNSEPTTTWCSDVYSTPCAEILIDYGRRRSAGIEASDECHLDPSRSKPRSLELFEAIAPLMLKWLHGTLIVLVLLR